MITAFVTLELVSNCIWTTVVRASAGDLNIKQKREGKGDANSEIATNILCNILLQYPLRNSSYL